MLNKTTFLFFQKLAGAWESEDKEHVWLFDQPDEHTTINWHFQIKMKPIKEFIKHDCLLFDRFDGNFKLVFGGVLGTNEYLLSFLDDDSLQTRTRLDNKEFKQVLFRKKDVESLFEVE